MVCTLSPLLPCFHLENIEQKVANALHPLLILFLYLLRSISSQSSSNSRKKLDNFVDYYEPVQSQVLLLDQSVFGSPKKMTIIFDAFQRTFRLKLQIDSPVLSSSAKVIVHETSGEVNSFSADSFKESLVTGRESSDPFSFVHGSLYDNRFHGIIHLQSEIFYIERVNSLFNETDSSESVIYRHSDINLTRFFCDAENKKDCRLLHMDALQGPRIPAPQLPVQQNEGTKSPVRMCTIKLVADHTFFQKAGDSSVLDTVKEMLFHVTEADKNFRATNFRVKGVQIFGLQATELEVFKTAMKQEMLSESMSASDFLEEFSDKDFNSFCLGISFVQRSFPNGLLGLAFTAKPDNIIGGICTRRILIPNWRSMKSLNTAVVSVEAFHKRMLRAVSILTLTHEIGHSFGSDHDPEMDETCSPSDINGGRYVMAANAVPGDLPNHKQFSPCSIEQMQEILLQKSGCFKDGQPICGNAILEEGEDCDCGPVDLCESIDRCCNPSNSEAKCKLKTSALCSPKASKCCNSLCEYTPKLAKMDCTFGNDCYYPAICDGQSSDCPRLQVKPDGTPCENGVGVCENGVCHDTACARKNKQRCICAGFEFICLLCCRDELGHCSPASTLGILNSSGNSPILPDGKQCNQGLGVCVGGWCRMANEKAFFSKDENVAPYLNFSLMIIIVLALIIVISVIIKLGFIYFSISRFCDSYDKALKWRKSKERV